jgi:hypothetical protein
MALQDSGSGAVPAVSMSVADINVELANNFNDPLDFAEAAASFSGILPGTVELLEFYNKTFAGGTGDYGSLESHALRFLVFSEQGESDVNTGWISENGELVLCAENADLPDDSRGPNTSTAVNSDTEFIDDFISGDLTVGDVVYKNEAGSALTDLRPGTDFPSSNTHFMLDTTSNKIFDVNSSAVIQNVISRTPNVPTKPTLVADSGTQITVTIPTTNTAVTREFDIHRSIGGASFTRVGTVVPSDSGSIDDTSISTTFVDSSGISAGNSVVYKVFAQNAFATSSASTTSDSVTTPAGTSWGSFTNYSMTLGSGTSQTLESSEQQLTLTNGSGNTTITVEQPNNSNPPPDLEIKVGNATGNYNLISSYTESPSAIAAASTYFFKTKLSQQGSKNNSSETCDIVFTNNGVQKTITLTVSIGGGGGFDP